MTVLQRRILILPSLNTLREEVEHLRAVEEAGDLQAAGNWSLDQCCQHLGRWVQFSIDGFAFQYPWPYRLLGRLMRLVSWRGLVHLALRPGFVNPPSVKAVEPDACIDQGQGVAYL